MGHQLGQMDKCRGGNGMTGQGRGEETAGGRGGERRGSDGEKGDEGKSADGNQGERGHGGRGRAKMIVGQQCPIYFYI